MGTLVSKDLRLSQLLPYDAQTKTKCNELTSGLKEYRMLTVVLDEAILTFSKGELEKFDSLVGENACQVRAVEIITIAKKEFLNLAQVQEKIITIQNSIDGILSGKTLDLKKQKNTSLKDLLVDHHLDIELTEEATYFATNYLLTETKVQKSNDLYIKEVADSKKLLRFGDISVSFADKLVRKFRQMVSVHSVDFVKKCAQSMNDSQLIRMNSEEFIYKHNTYWPCLPMFWTYKTLLKTTCHLNVPLLIHAKIFSEDKCRIDSEKFIVYRSSKDGVEHYIEADSVEPWMHEPVLVVEGISQPNRAVSADWKFFFDGVSIEDVILSGAADHRQYPDDAQDKKIEDLNDLEFQNYKKNAKRWGFSMENPSVFFIQHVYGAYLDHIPEISKKK